MDPTIQPIDYKEDFIPYIRNRTIVPVISNSFRLEEIFADDEELCAAIKQNTPQFYDEARTIDQELTKKWADETVVHGVLHQSPMDLIRRMRLDHASRLLTSDRGSVSEIAYAVGFKSVSRFSTACRQQFGMSPTEFRNSFKKAGPPKA